MPIGSVFSVPSNEKSKIDCINRGFCGILTDISTDSKNPYIKFTVPNLADVFDELKISTSQNNITSVKFYPENNVNVIDSIPMSIKALQSADINESFSINDFDTNFTYKEAPMPAPLPPPIRAPMPAPAAAPLPPPIRAPLPVLVIEPHEVWPTRNAPQSRAIRVYLGSFI